MSILVIAEHDHGSIKSATLNTVTAAAQIGGDVHVLVAGQNAGAAAAAAAQIAGVSKVLHADGASLAVIDTRSEPPRLLASRTVKLGPKLAAYECLGRIADARLTDGQEPVRVRLDAL